MEQEVSKNPWPRRLARLEEAGWRVVPDRDFTRTPGRQMVLHDRFFSCHLPAGERDVSLFYNEVEHDFSVADFEASCTAWFAIVEHHHEPFDLLVDMHRLVMADDRFTRLMQESPAGFGVFTETHLVDRWPRQVTVILPRDSSQYFWAGLIPQVTRTAPALFTEAEPAWAHVAATADERRACAMVAEIAFGESGLGLVERIAQRLDTEPGLELVAVAKELGMSPRSLQRRLSEEGFKFAELREQARLRRSVVLVESGAKVETIAREVGFASTSHFIQWFRRHTGQTPGERRAPPRA